MAPPQTSKGRTPATEISPHCKWSYTYDKETHPFLHTTTRQCQHLEFQNLIATDLPGRYSITLLWGHKYLFVMFDININFINTVPIKNRTTPELIKGFKHCHKYLKKRRFRAKLLRLDNEVSKDLIAHIEAEQLMCQLASIGDHQTNPAECAIQTFKSHFNAIISGTDSEFPSNCWGLLISQAVITLNLLRPP